MNCSKGEIPTLVLRGDQLKDVPEARVSVRVSPAIIVKAKLTS